MKQLTLRWVALVFALSAILFLGACHKKPAPPPPSPPPAPAAPTATLTASPDTIDKGQSSTLTWQTANATDVGIDGVGAVQPSGTQSVSPAATTTYSTAKGAAQPDRDCNRHGKYASASTTASTTGAVGHRGTAVRAERKGHLLRL